MDKQQQPSFAEGIATLKAAAETVMAEAQRMEAAAKRFASLKPSQVMRKANRR
jgi:hypothetical protein